MYSDGLGPACFVAISFCRCLDGAEGNFLLIAVSRSARYPPPDTELSELPTSTVRLFSNVRSLLIVALLLKSIIYRTNLLSGKPVQTGNPRLCTLMDYVSMHRLMV